MTCGCSPKPSNDHKRDVMSTSAEAQKIIMPVQFLYLDDQTCVPCSGTGQALEQAIDSVSELLDALGVELQVEKIHISNRDIAQAYEFLSSPTIRVNGIDIDPLRTEEDCPSCGDLAGGDASVSCRNWHWRGEVSTTAPVGKIVEAITAAALQMSDAAQSWPPKEDVDTLYEMPQNMINFFSARANDQRTCC